MNHLVKMITDDDGAEYPNQHWHLSWRTAGSASILCTGEVYGIGEGAAKAEHKTTKRGGITCPECLKQIKAIKAIKL